MKAKAAVFMGVRTPFEIREFDVTAGSLSIPLTELADVEIPMLYGGE